MHNYNSAAWNVVMEILLKFHILLDVKYFGQLSI